MLDPNPPPMTALMPDPVCVDGTSLPPTLLTNAQSARCDQLATAAGIDVATLMMAAGRAVAAAVLDRYKTGKIIVLCGPGNNGGDGYEAACFLRAQGRDVSVVPVLPVPPKGPAAMAAARWGGPLTSFDSSWENDGDIIVDAIFGVGLSRALDGKAQDAVERMSRSGKPIIAVDIPSGLQGDSGQVLGAAPTCEVTVTFFRLKPAHRLYPGRQYCGQILLADIGIPESFLDQVQPQFFRNDPRLWIDRWPWPRIDSHKYSRGHVTIIGGNMPGAARLAAIAARRIGAGYVNIAISEEQRNLYTHVEPGTVISPIKNPDGLQALLVRRLPGAFLIGPGGGVGDAVRQATRTLLATGVSIVIDADALSSFADDPSALFALLHDRCILTPHEGEFGRLFSRKTDRLSNALAAAELSGAIVVLKGPDTIVALPSGAAVINDNAPADLASAGTGDVLAGMISALMAQGLTPGLAAAAGVWMQGEAARRRGPGLIAEDLPEEIPYILQQVKENSPSLAFTESPDHRVFLHNFVENYKRHAQ